MNLRDLHRNHRVTIPAPAPELLFTLLAVAGNVGLALLFLYQFGG